jgi:hypothetical protein
VPRFNDAVAFCDMGDLSAECVIDHSLQQRARLPEA